MQTRRDFGKLALASLPLSCVAATPKLSSRIHGVEIGVAAYSYNGLPREDLLDVIVKSMADCGIGDCLLYAPATEPPDLASKARPMRLLSAGPPAGRAGAASGRAGGASGGAGRGRGPATPEQAAAIEALRQWHLTVPLNYYVSIRKKFSDAGLTIHTYERSFLGTVSDEDIDRACAETKTLGAATLAEPFSRSVAKRVAPIAAKYGVRVAFQGRPSINPADSDLMAKQSDFAEAVGYSKNFGTSIDVGDATFGGWDALQFVKDTHATVFSLNLKDRTKAGVSVPWGEGDAHIKDILQLIRDKKYPIRCYIDCDYATADDNSRLADIKRCFEFAKSALV
jgi:sugar phosphate isomerase/epimerase